MLSSQESIAQQYLILASFGGSREISVVRSSLFAMRVCKSGLQYEKADDCNVVQAKAMIHLM